MERIGQILKNARMQKGLSLEQVSDAIKIKAEKLQAIEDGDWALLPRFSFTKGYIRSYARFLELESTSILGDLEAEIQESKSEHLKADQLSAHKDVSVKTNHWPVRAVEIFSVITLFFVITLIHQTISKYKAENIAEQSVRKNLGISGAPFESLAQEDDLLKRIEEAKRFSMLETVPPHATLTVEPDYDIFTASHRSIASLMNKTKLKRTVYKQEIQIFAKEKIRVHYEIDQKEAFSKGILDGGRLVLKGQDSVSLRIMGLKNSQVLHNGKPVNLAHASGSIMRLNFP